jgi:Aspartyl protease
MRLKLAIGASLIMATRLYASPSPNPTCAECDIPLHYDSELVKQGFPSPLVILRIGDHEAAFIIDTGASVNTFAAWFAEEAGVSIRDSTATAMGSTGASSKLRTASPFSAISENGLPIPIQQAIVVDFPPIFKTNRLGGLLSPQLLAPRGRAAVLDLREPSLRFKPFDSAFIELGLKQMNKAGEPHVCINRGSQFVNRLYLAPISVAGISGAMLVDTGATRTLVTANSRIGQSLAQRSAEGQHSQGVGGPVQTTRTVTDVGLSFVGRELPLRSITIGGSSSDCGPDGLLGMDVLQSCVLILDTSRAAARCS